jgi:hypothetical protein
MLVKGANLWYNGPAAEEDRDSMAGARKLAEVGWAGLVTSE